MIVGAPRFPLLAGLSIGLLIFHSASAAHVSSPINHRMTTNEDKLERRSDDQQLANTTTLPAANSPDGFVINSLEDEKKFGLKILDKRHRYDQQQASLADSQLEQVAAPAAIQQEEPSEKQQIEPRNEQEAVQLNDQQQQLPDQIIIDHRPSGADPSSSSVDSFGPSTQSPPTSTTSSSLNTQASTQSSTMSPFVQQSSGSQSSAMASQPQIQWVPAASNQQVIYARQAQPASSSNSNNQQQQQFGNMMSASNQLMTSVQYPTSINSIISDQQQQPQQQANNQQQQTAGQFQTQIVNGQQQLVFVPSSLNSQVLGMAPNGRRMSISNWLRGLGSMLSNIFYRRDHGAPGNAQLQTGAMMMQASGSAPSGSWIQLGPNAPHWLTQAQSAIQQFQQQHQQIGLPGSTRLSSFLSGTPQQQATANTMTIAMPQQQLNNANTFQQQQAQMSDLQTSGSSSSYVAIQPPAMVTNQPYQQQPQPQSNMAAQGQTVLVGQLQPAASNVAAEIQIQQHPGSIQVVSASQSQQPQASPAAKSNPEQIKQVAVSGQSQSSVIPSSSGTNHSRFGRSSKHQTQTKPQQHQQLQPQPPQMTTPTSQTTNGNLPLAHYSHYSATD